MTNATNPHFGEIPSEAIDLAEKHVSDILKISFDYSESNQKALVIYDAQCDLTKALTEAYRRCLPQAKFINFDNITQDEILAEFSNLKPSDFVALVQSTSFRLDKFRIRVTLFNKSIKVIEHPHLSRMLGIDEQLCYIDSLAYDPTYFRGVGQALKAFIDKSDSCTLDSGGAELIYSAGFEDVKLNIGDYTGMHNVGGQFPIGEVFTESKDLEALNGRVRIFAFSDTSFSINKPETPITLVIADGKITEAIDSTSEFDQVLANIRRDEGGEVWLRELGLGLNRAFTKDRLVTDTGSYERMCGVHISLGTKHNVYKKTIFEDLKKSGRYHVDIFVDTHAVVFDGKNIFRDDNWIISD